MRFYAAGPSGPKGTLSVVLAGHPELKNDLLRASMEEIGARTTVFELNGFGNDKKKYLYWLLEQVTAPKTKADTLLTEAATALLCERLTTPFAVRTVPDPCF